MKAELIKEIYNPVETLPVQLSVKSKKILTDAHINKSISTIQVGEIASCATKNGKIFIHLMQVLSEFFNQYGIIVTYPRLINSPSNEALKELTLETIADIKSAIKTRTEKSKKKSKVAYSDGTVQLGNSSGFFLPGTFRKDGSSDHSQDDLGFNWYMQNGGKHKLLEQENLNDLIRLAQQGDIRARNNIMEHNQKLVVSIAKKYHHTSTIDLMDFIQEGNFGLIEAIEKFDISLGFAFSTYATQWIRQKITRFIQDFAGVVRLPAYIQEDLSKLRKAHSRLFKELGRDPTEEELVTCCIDITNIPDLIQLTYVRMNSVDEYAFGEDEPGSTLGDYILNPIDANPHQLLEAKEILQYKISEIIEFVDTVKNLQIKERNKEMFMLYYNIESTEINNFGSIGQKFDVSRERVRQIINSTWSLLEKMGCPVNEVKLIAKMDSYLELQDLTRMEIPLS